MTSAAGQDPAVVLGGSPASLAPPGLAGLDARWSRLVSALDGDGVVRSWHVLDSHADTATQDIEVAGTAGTLVCVHGNPTWSYAFRRVLAEPPDGWRVLAVDHLDMGYSERTGVSRRLARRIDDLDRVLAAAVPDGPVVLLAHDWGGPIALGWALRNRARLAGIVLSNTAVHQPADAPAPAMIRAVRQAGVLDTLAMQTSGFLRGALALARPAVTAEARAGYLAPYTSPDRRRAIAEFVADIPLEPDHPSAAALDEVAGGLDLLAEVPVLLWWGPDDPVFSDRYLHDLERRLPHADVHRVETASHLTPEHPALPSALRTWMAARVMATGQPAAMDEAAPGEAAPDEAAPDEAAPSDPPRRALWSVVARPELAGVQAIVEPPRRGESEPRRVTFGELDAEAAALAAGLAQHGVGPGTRVACLVPPGRELAGVLLACWQLGAVVVIADAGLGVMGMTRALRSAAPSVLIGIPRALTAATALRWPGVRIAAGQPPAALRSASGVVASLGELIAAGLRAEPLDRGGPDADADAAIAFTSGSTGPAKGVLYRHRQLEAQRDALVRTYGITAEDRLVAAFAPFALYGPLMGITSMVPDMDVTAPSTLQAGALADAVAAADATLVFASPAALRNVVATADELNAAQRDALAGVRLLLSAGAPVPAELLRAFRALMPDAEAHTPYGMTEVLPVADIDLATIEAVGPGQGVCVGHPVPGVEVALSPLDADAVGGGGPLATGALTTEPEVTGEVCVRAGHVKARYDRLALTELGSSRNAEWHRSGDVGHLDVDGRLWIEGRLAHVITTPTGIVTPVGIERRVESIPRVTMAAAVGVGPPGAQQVVVVVTTDPRPARAQLAPLSLTDRVRRVVTDAWPALDVAAVIAVDRLPVDIRHESKIDRAEVARRAAALLAGRGLAWRRTAQAQP